MSAVPSGAAFGVPNAVAEIALSLSAQPTSGELIAALVKAEAAGYERARRERPPSKAADEAQPCA